MKDRRSTSLKQKQVRLLELFRTHGPISTRSVTPHIHGDDSHEHVKMVHKQVQNLQSRGLIKLEKVGDREHGKRGARPLLWVACEVQA